MFDVSMEPVKRRVLQVTDDFGCQSEALTQGTEGVWQSDCYAALCA